MILKSLALISILVSWVCAMQDNQVETGTDVVIRCQDYSNTNLGESLKKNANVTRLTIDTNYDYRLEGAYENFKNVVQEGLQNKPNLEYLRIIGQFNHEIFFQQRSITDTNIYEINDRISSHQQDPRLAWFFNLQELQINGDHIGTLPDSVVFSNLTEQSRNLKKLEITGSCSGYSFDRSQVKS